MAPRLAIAAAPAAVVVYLSFNAGGFFAGAPAVAATVVGLALVLRILIAPEPFAGLGTGLVAAVACLGLYGVWTLASAAWSDAPGTAMIEFDRVLLCWLALVLFGSLPYDRRTIEYAARALAVAIVAIAGIALFTRLLPDVWAADAVVANDRLSYPLTYWNALGILSAVGVVLCTHMAAATTGSRLARMLAAAALPLLAATMYFTFSRGAILAVLIGLIAYALLARPKGLLSVAIAALPFTAILTAFSYRADLLASGRYASEAGIEQGHEVALIAVACVVATALVRLWMIAALDDRLDRWSPTREAKRRTGWAALAVVLAALVAAIAAGAPQEIGDQYENFTTGDSISDTGDLRGRLTEIGNNGRLAQWEVALDSFRAQPVRGEGAGTFPQLWARDGEEGLKVEDAHSLYLEVLAELGLPGLLLLGATLVILLAGLAIESHRRASALHAALFAAGLMWALHAGVDWDWEMPATGLFLFALGALALSRGEEEPARMPDPPRFARLALGAGCLALLVTPTLMALSQGKLNSALDAFKRGNCAQASDDALAAAELVPARPQPFQILGYCNTKAGEYALGIQMAETAVDRDPGNWESYYGLALARGAAGEDPRPAAREALELNPNSPLARRAVRLFDTEDPQEWRRRATKARLPIL